MPSLTSRRWWSSFPHEKELHLFTNIFNSIETIRIYHYTMDDKNYIIGPFLASFANLKRLIMTSVDFTDAATNDFFHRTYPKLTDFHYIDCLGPMLPFTSFLERNPGLKTLRIESNAEYFVRWISDSIGLFMCSFRWICF